ncbi:MAG: hypothetical protein FWG50_07180 [Kiritimatiellaeota bacterium]|nr:hypothetical protein [Kiritimatiellota bacterium]
MSEQHGDSITNMRINLLDAVHVCEGIFREIDKGGEIIPPSKWFYKSPSEMEKFIADADYSSWDVLEKKIAQRMA